MASGLLSLKWNNHKSTFFHVLSTIRSKDSYSDVTIACDGQFYTLHKFVLSTCSEYFEAMFERTQCKHPVIVLKDIKCEDFESLLNYMYVGEVNVVQEKLASLIKAAECLQIKGLAVPDEDPMENAKSNSVNIEQQNKRIQRLEDGNSPRAKRRRRNNSFDNSDEIVSPVRTRLSGRNKENQSSYNISNKSSSEEHLNQSENDGTELISNNSRKIRTNRNSRTSSQIKNSLEPAEVIIDDDTVKSEPVEESSVVELTDSGGGSNDATFTTTDTAINAAADDEEEDGSGGCNDNKQEADEVEEMVDNKEALHQQLGFDPQSQDVYEDVGDAATAGYQENSFPLWEGAEGGSLASTFTASDSFTTDQQQQGRPMAVMTSQSSEGTTPTTTTTPTSLNWLSIQDVDEVVVTANTTRLPSNAHDTDSATTAATITTAGQYFISESASATTSFADTSTPRQKLLFMNESTDDDTEHQQQQGCSYYQCKLCPFSTPHSNVIMTHSRTHQTTTTTTSGGSSNTTLLRPHACSYCPYHASQKQALVSHLRTHTGERPFSCPHCAYRSTLKHHLTRHMAALHKDVFK